MRKLDPHPTPIEPDLTPYLWHPTPVGPLPSEDGVPLETNWHVLQMTLLMQSLTWHWRDRTDSFVGGNMFVYWDEELARNEYFRGPDVFAVKDGVSNERTREHWEVWTENGRFPDLIVELMSKSTRRNDLTTKKQVYEERFETPDFVAYDPESKEFFVWHKKDGRFQRVVADKQGRYRLAGIGLRLGPWHGTFEQRKDDWVRFFDSAGNLVPTRDEAANLRADSERARAEGEKARAEAATLRAIAERARADALAAELARLKSQRKP
ncbi:MAG TPA: Uma2 family endonuclease [Gemmataceae bacterium]|jgi:Uma2 family endonuclease|nr:Uma2 family endonuclease [Gemmataceae bacterium]